MEVFSKKLGEPKKKISSSALKALSRYEWPGNVRELQNLIERLSVMIESDEINLEHIPKKFLNGGSYGATSTDESSVDASSLKEARSDFEKRFIEESLRKFAWNISKTAEAIGVERSNLHRKIKSYGIEVNPLKENS